MWENPKWVALAEEYDKEHQSDWNQIFHYVGIPFIFLALIRWTQLFPPIHVFPWFALILPVYYLWSFRMGIAMTIAMIILAAFSYYYLTPWSALVLFIVGWVLQFVGHSSFEKNNPSFMHNLIHLFIAPGWVLQRFVHKTIGVDLW